jgi:hypothetical protein
MINKITLVLLLISTAITGCAFNSTEKKQNCASFYYLNPNKTLTSYARVALFELENDSEYPQIASDITQTLFHELQKKQVFSLKVVQKKDPIWTNLQFDLNAVYNIDQLYEIQKKVRTDAILVGTVTEYQPYPHQLLGLRLKLVDLEDGQVIWGFEEVWDTNDKITIDRIKTYFKNQQSSPKAPLKRNLVGVSSIKFLKYTAWEVALTLKK